MEEETKEVIVRMAEQKKDKDDEEEEESGDRDDPCRSLQTSFLPELNLLMLIAFLSLPSGECLQSEVASKEGSRWDLEEMMPELRARNQRRERNEYHDIGHRKTPRTRTRIMDSRCNHMNSEFTEDHALLFSQNCVKFGSSHLQSYVFEIWNLPKTS